MIQPLHRKVKAVVIVGSFLSAVGTGLAALSVVNWQTVGGVVATAAIASITGYRTGSQAN